MILLIQRLDIFAIDTALIFKFHYDSINSRKEFADKAEIGVFKFHYDSINSTIVLKLFIAVTYLNSIMILLILVFTTIFMYSRE